MSSKRTASWGIGLVLVIAGALILAFAIYNLTQDKKGSGASAIVSMMLMAVGARTMRRSVK